MRPRALVAPDSFRGTFDAPIVARTLGAGLEEAGWEVDLCPVADGGEGTMALLVEALGGEFVATRASDPLGRPVDCLLGLVEGGATAIVEMAQASGMALVGADERDPWAASTRGTGELILAAATTGARKIVVAVGGSATTDGGAGAIEAIRAGGGLQGGTRLEVLCDVAYAFEQAPRVFGPQKGANDAMVTRLEKRLDVLADTLPRDPRGVRATGCAGGLSGGLWAAFDAELRAGAPAVLKTLGVGARMRAVQLVVAGEGCIDEQSFGGKIVGELVSRAHEAGVPIHAVAGRSKLSGEEAAAAGLARVWTASTLDEIAAAGRALGAAIQA